jgi:hypothetical protein
MQLEHTFPLIQHKTKLHMKDNNVQSLESKDNP